jgi:Kef-type K+ transport system membrane component KefB
MTGVSSITAIVLLDLAVMTALGTALANLAGRWGQPAVVGEIVAGIALGPTLLGLFPGNLPLRLFPLDGRPFLTVLADLGLVLFMFGVGLELDPGLIRRTGSSALAVSLGSTLLPLALGVTLALALYPWNSGGAHHHTRLFPFALFLGVAMSITAFPVLARILTGLRMHRRGIGAFVMSCAALADLAAWCLLAIVVALTRRAGWSSMVLTLGGMVVFLAVLAFVIRPVLRIVLCHRLVRAQHRASLIVLLIFLLLAAWVTTRLGFQPIFGAFAFGAAVPRDALKETAPEAPMVVDQMSQLLVPVFFITTGLSVDISGLGTRGLIEAGLVLTVACLGKFAGAAGAARTCRMEVRKAAAVGVLMNSRGLTELVAIDIGVSLGVLDKTLAAALILMAIITTIATPPLFRVIHSENPEDAAAARPRPAVAGDQAFGHVAWQRGTMTTGQAASEYARDDHGRLSRWKSDMRTTGGSSPRPRSPASFSTPARLRRPATKTRAECISHSAARRISPLGSGDSPPRHAMEYRACRHRSALHSKRSDRCTQAGLPAEVPQPGPDLEMSSTRSVRPRILLAPQKPVIPSEWAWRY